MTLATKDSNYMHVHVLIHMSLLHISGVLAGMWPCGIVVLLAELFTAESKSQVYAALHELLSNHSHISSSLRKYKQSWLFPSCALYA